MTIKINPLCYLIVVFFFASLGTLASPQLKVIQGEDLLSGKNISISSTSKKGLVVVFLSAKCPCSNSHIKELSDLAKSYSDFSFVAVHSNVDEAKAISKPYFQKAALSFPVLEDDKSHWADFLQALKTPHAFVFSANGDLLYQGGVSNSKDCGASDRKFLREALEDVHGERKVRTAEGRTLGCVISRGEKYVW